MLFFWSFIFSSLPVIFSDNLHPLAVAVKLLKSLLALGLHQPVQLGIKVDTMSRKVVVFPRQPDPQTPLLGDLPPAAAEDMVLVQMIGAAGDITGFFLLHDAFAHCVSPRGLKMQIILGKGALFLLSPNFNLPFINLTST